MDRVTVMEMEMWCHCQNTNAGYRLPQGKGGTITAYWITTRSDHLHDSSGQERRQTVNSHELTASELNMLTAATGVV